MSIYRFYRAIYYADFEVSFSLYLLFVSILFFALSLASLSDAEVGEDVGEEVGGGDGAGEGGEVV